MSSDPSITVMVVGPTTRCDVQNVQADYMVFNKLVNGSISGLRLPDDLARQGFGAYCDDNAVLVGQPDNHFAAHLGHARLCGPIVIFRMTPDGEERSLTPDDVRTLGRYLSGAPSSAAQAETDADRLFWAAHPSGVAVQSFDSIDDFFKAMGLSDG